LKYAAKSDIGKRVHNEDSFLLPEKSGFPLFFAVADGMGGHAAGAVASSLLIQKLKGFDQSLETDFALERLREAIERANRSVFEEAEQDRALHGMGTTLVAALLLGDRYIAANVGDSRMYCFDGEILEAVTIDHSLVEQLVRAGAITREEARLHPQRNIITRAVGVSTEVDVDLFEREWKSGDILVLCSDGLHGAVKEADLIRTLSDDLSLEGMCDQLVSLALEQGGTDNVTVVLIRLEEGDAV
jgi:PPM family protein phosphatase